MILINVFFRDACLLALLFGLLIGAHADIIDRESCRNVLYRDARNRVQSYGDMRRVVDRIVTQASQIVTDADGLMEDVEKGEAEPYDEIRSEKMFHALLPMIGPARIIDQRGWTKAAEQFSDISNFFQTREQRRPTFVCGDEHLEKYFIIDNGTPDGRRVKSVKPGERVRGFQYRDHFLERQYPNDGRQWAPVDVKAPCRKNGPRARAHTKRGRRGYIFLCAPVLDPANSEYYTISDRDRDHDWSIPRHRRNPNWESYLDYWAFHISYVAVHEMFHLLFDDLDHPLCEAVLRRADDIYIERAYRFDGSYALLRQSPHDSPTNVDSKGMIALALFMDTNSWHHGTAMSKADTIAGK